MTRYSVKGKLIPLIEQEIVAAQRLGRKDLEADSLDKLGVLHAYLGYLPQAIQYFEIAYKIADQLGHKKLKRDVQAHIRLAQKQSKKKSLSSGAKFYSFFRLILLRLKLIFEG